MFCRASSHTLTTPVRNPRISVRDICPQDRRSASENAFHCPDHGADDNVRKQPVVNPLASVAANACDVVCGKGPPRRTNRSLQEYAAPPLREVNPAQRIA